MDPLLRSISFALNSHGSQKESQEFNFGDISQSLDQSLKKTLDQSSTQSSDQTSGNFFACFPSVVGEIFNGNAVAGVFVVSLLLSLVLPEKKKKKGNENM